MEQMLSGRIWNLDCALKAHVPLSILIEDPVLRFKNTFVLHGRYTLRKGVVDETGAVRKEMCAGILLLTGSSWMD